jgi:hypothetical protein
MNIGTVIRLFSDYVEDDREGARFVVCLLFH